MTMQPPSDNPSDATDDLAEATSVESQQATAEPDGIAGQINAAAQNDAPSDAESQLAEQKDRILRLTAELENSRSRAARELVDIRKYASLELARAILPVVDNIDRAIEAAEKDDQSTGQSTGLLEGFKLVRQQLIAALAQHQCEPIAAEGEAFDPQFHEAILQQPSADVPANHITLVTQTGYRMHDRVVRPSQVIVSSGPAE